MSRRAFKERFVGHGSYSPSNLRRALVSLSRMGYITLQEGPNLSQPPCCSTLCCPPWGDRASHAGEGGSECRERRWERGGGMSKGPGFVMRRVVEELEATDNGTLTRAELEDVLVPLGIRSDSILWAIRRLARLHVLRLAEGRFAETTRVILSQPVENLIPEDEILDMLKSMR